MYTYWRCKSHKSVILMPRGKETLTGPTTVE
jgi:hypothetical protein